MTTREVSTAGGTAFHDDFEDPADDDAGELALNAARDRLPDWRIIEVHGGYVAVPADTVIIDDVTLDGLVRRAAGSDE